MFRSPALSSTEKASPPRRPPYIPALLPDSLRSALRMDIYLKPHAKKHESLWIQSSVPIYPRYATFWVNSKVFYEPLGYNRLRGTWNYFFVISRKDIAPLSASRRPTPSSLSLPFPPRARGFPSGPCCSTGRAGAMAAPAWPGWGDSERPCGSSWGSIAAPFRGCVSPTMLVVFKAPKSWGWQERERGLLRRGPVAAHPPHPHTEMAPASSSSSLTGETHPELSPCAPAAGTALVLWGQRWELTERRGGRWRRLWGPGPTPRAGRRARGCTASLSRGAQGGSILKGMQEYLQETS